VHATGTISNYSISWDARLAPDGTGIGTEQLSSGGCDVAVPFSVRPAALDPPGAGSSGLKITPSTITLRTKVGSTTSPASVTVRNPGTGTDMVLAVHLAGDSKAFKLGDGTCERGIAVPAGQSCDVAVSFDAYRSGPIHGTIAVDYIAGGRVKTATVSLTGTQVQTQAQILESDVVVLVKQINIDRKRNGAGPLVLDPTVSKCATQHSKQIALANNLSHNDPRDICVPHKHGAENVGEDPSQPVSRALLKMEAGFVSEGPCPHRPCTPGDLVNHSHWAFLMNRVFTRVGIGVYVRGPETWLTEDFFTP
jgi:Cysteine-rich secretory protein family